MVKMFNVIYTLLESMESMENCLSPNLDSLSGLKISVLVLVKVSIKKHTVMALPISLSVRYKIEHLYITRTRQNLKVI
jgi:hypothetical protein